VVASSPRNSTHPVYGAKAWQKTSPFQHEPFSTATVPRCHAIILFDPRDTIDRRYLEGEVLPQFAGADVRRVPFSGHPSNQVLSEVGFIAPFVRAVLAGQPRSAWPVLDRRAQRTKSAAYFQVLALLAVQRRHVAWADALVARSLVLKPRSMLALRTQGMVRLAQKRWAEAESVLESALALDPKDPLTISLLAHARRGEPPPPTPPPSAAPVPTPWQRVRRRLRQLLGHA
jgi:hypothetical protein